MRMSMRTSMRMRRSKTNKQTTTTHHRIFSILRTSITSIPPSYINTASSNNLFNIRSCSEGAATQPTLTSIRGCHIHNNTRYENQHTACLIKTAYELLVVVHTASLPVRVPRFRNRWHFESASCFAPRSIFHSL